MSRANVAQAEFWGGDPGARWVALHDDLDRQHDSIRALLMERADLRSGEAVLDVGCGGGALTLSAARAVGPSGRADGIDISPLLLRLAETAREKAGLDQARFFEADAQTFAFSERYDAVISRFGVMFFDDPVAAFANLRRALRPGGRLICAAWADAAANPWFGEVRAVAVERLGAPPPGDPDAPGPLAFRDTERVTAILRAAGFVSLAVREREVTLLQTGGWAAMERLLPAIGPIPGVLREQGGTDADLSAIIAKLRRRWSGYQTPEGIALPGRIVLIEARAPETPE